MIVSATDIQRRSPSAPHYENRTAGTPIIASSNPLRRQPAGFLVDWQPRVLPTQSAREAAMAGRCHNWTSVHPAIHDSLTVVPRRSQEPLSGPGIRSEWHRQLTSRRFPLQATRALPGGSSLCRFVLVLSFEIRSEPAIPRTPSIETPVTGQTPGAIIASCRIKCGHFRTSTALARRWCRVTARHAIGQP